MKEICKNCLKQMDNVTDSDYREVHWCSNCGTILKVSKSKYIIAKPSETWNTPETYLNKIKEK